MCCVPDDVVSDCTEVVTVVVELCYGVETAAVPEVCSLTVEASCGAMLCDCVSVVPVESGARDIECNVGASAYSSSVEYVTETAVDCGAVGPTLLVVR